jgi:hypothetical protein
MSRALNCLQRSNIHLAFIKRQIKPYRENKYSMLHAAFNSVAELEAASDTPKNHKDALGHKSQAQR